VSGYEHKLENEIRRKGTELLTNAHQAARGFNQFGRIVADSILEGDFHVFNIRFLFRGSL